MNIEEIKVRVKEEFYIKRDIDFYEAQDDVIYLLSIIEQAEKALEDIKHISSPHIDTYAINILARQALQVIRGN